MYIFDKENHKALRVARKLSQINLKEYLEEWLNAVETAKTTLLNSSYYKGTNNG